MNIKSSILAISGLIFVASQAEDNDWSFRAGLFHQSLQDIELHGFSFNHGNFVDGSVSTGNGGPANTVYTTADFSNQVPVNGTSVTYHNATLGGADGDTESVNGIIFEGLKLLRKSGNWDFSLNISTTFALHDSQVGVGANSNFTTYDLTLNPWNGGVPTSNTHTDPNPPVPLAGVNNGDIKAMVEYDLDMTLATIGVAAEVGYSIKDFRFFLQGGPTLAIADAELSRNESASFVADGSGFYSHTESESVIEVIPGFFAGLGAEWKFDENWGIFMAGRYDFGFYDLTTDYADVNLNRLSLQLGLTCNF